MVQTRQNTAGRRPKSGGLTSTELFNQLARENDSNLRRIPRRMQVLPSIRVARPKQRIGSIAPLRIRATTTARHDINSPGMNITSTSASFVQAANSFRVARTSQSTDFFQFTSFSHATNTFHSAIASAVVPASSSDETSDTATTDDDDNDDDDDDDNDNDDDVVFLREVVLPTQVDQPDQPDQSLTESTSSITNAEPNISPAQAAGSIVTPPIFTMADISKRLSEAVKCPICFDRFEDPVIVVECGHCFCFECIENWQNQSKRTCPCCRELILSRPVSAHFLHTVLDVARDLSQSGT